MSRFVLCFFNCEWGLPLFYMFIGYCISLSSTKQPIYIWGGGCQWFPDLFSHSFFVIEPLLPRPFMGRGKLYFSDSPETKLATWLNSSPWSVNKSTLILGGVFKCKWYLLLYCPSFFWLECRHKGWNLSNHFGSWRWKPHTETVEPKVEAVWTPGSFV